MLLEASFPGGGRKLNGPAKGRHEPSYGPLSGWLFQDPKPASNRLGGEINNQPSYLFRAMLFFFLELHIFPVSKLPMT